MSEKIFSHGRTIHSVAYDLALTLATKDEDTNTPYDLLRRIAHYLPVCIEAAEEFKESESGPPVTDIKVTF